MPDRRKIVKVFLASPGDLSDERRAAKAAVDEVNGLFANEFGYHVELVGWEDTVSVFGRPQATINAELEDCEYFIGMMWKRWGTPPNLSGPYTSGFEEEFKRSVDRRLRTGRPEISLLFKEIDPELLRDPGDELKKVLAFKSQLVAEKSIYFESFSKIGELEAKLRRCVSKYIRGLLREEAAAHSDQSPTRPADGEPPQSTEATSVVQETPFSIEGARFLRDFISKTARNDEQDPIITAEVARFRLLASIIGQPGNDQPALGVHDANILLAEGGDFTFGRRELSGLLHSGLEHFENENAPLWRWYAALGGFRENLLPIYSFLGPTERRVGALSAMRLISCEPVPAGSQRRPREDYVRSWFFDGEPNAVKVAALGYLADLGVPADLPIVRRELDRGDYQTKGAATDAIIRISLRQSREKAIAALYELQPTSFSRSLLTALFENGASLSTEVLLQGISHANSEVRRITVKLLRSRGALPDQAAQQLTSDNDAIVRYEALKALADGGRTFSDIEAKGILVKPTWNSGLGGLGGFGSLGGFDSAGEACWKRYREERLRALRDGELEDAARENSIYDRVAQFILADRQFSLRGEKLRKSIDDQFQAEFAQSLDTMAVKFGNHIGDLLEKTRSLERHLRKSLTREGLNVICRRADPKDLGRVREALKSGFVDYSADDIEYLGRFGEWEDISLIIAAVERPDTGSDSLLLSYYTDSAMYRTAARVIYRMGRTRLSELLVMPAPSRLVAHLVAEVSDKVFRSLSDASLAVLLGSDDASVRKAAALKCVRALPKGRVTKILADYVSPGRDHYYNVVHWLDLGVSAPRDRALPAAEKILKKEWGRTDA